MIRATTRSLLQRSNLKRDFSIHTSSTSTCEAEEFNNINLLAKVMGVHCTLNDLSKAHDNNAYSLSFAQRHNMNNERKKKKEDVNEKSTFEDPVDICHTILYSKKAFKSSSRNDSVDIMKSQLEKVKSLCVCELGLPSNFSEEFHSSKEAIVVTEPTPPFRVVAVNKPWKNLCGYTQNEVEGRTLSVIQGEKTERDKITALLHTVVYSDLRQRPEVDGAGTILTNYKKSGEEFQNRLILRHVVDDNNEGQISHFAGYLRQIYV